MIKFEEDYTIFCKAAQIFELNVNKKEVRTDDYSHTQLMLCESNSFEVYTVVRYNMVYLEYKFHDGSTAQLLVVPPQLPKLQK